MTTPTQEAAEIVAEKLGNRWTAELVLSDPGSMDYAFARYVTEETEVTDAMVEAGEASLDRDDCVAGMFRAMIAAKHKGLRKVEADPLVEIMAEVNHMNDAKAAEQLREALAKRGKMIADIPVDTHPGWDDFRAAAYEAWEKKQEAPAIDEEAVLREAREAYAKQLRKDKCPQFADRAELGGYDSTTQMQALIATTRELHSLRAKVGEA